jgi:hypothetical protein
MGSRIQLLIVALWLSCVSVQAQDRPRSWKPVAPGMVFTRNFMVPQSPEKEGYRLLPQQYRLGTKAYANAPPEWWLELVAEAKIGDKWHPKEFPLAYVGEFKSKIGASELLVVQVSHAFTGDGFVRPGPEVYLTPYLFSIDGDKLNLKKQDWFIIRDMQYARLLAGKAEGRKIVFQTEGGRDFDCRVVYWKREWTLTVGDDNSFEIKKGEMIFVDDK